MQGEYGLREAVQEIKMKKEEIAIRDRYVKMCFSSLALNFDVINTHGLKHVARVLWSSTECECSKDTLGLLREEKKKKAMCVSWNNL